MPRCNDCGNTSRFERIEKQATEILCEDGEKVGEGETTPMGAEALVCGNCGEDVELA